MSTAGGCGSASRPWIGRYGASRSREKKQHYDPHRASERVQQLRATYRAEIARVPAEQLIFLDEVGATLNLTLEEGRAVRGQRVYGHQPTARGQRSSTIGALSSQGVETALGFEGPLNGAVFLYFLVHFLCPVLKPGQVVVVDNARAHQVDGVVELIEATGARVRYLPPYSPDLNPIELAWSKVKHALRKAQARTREALYEALSQALDTLTPANAQGYFKHVGICV
jgi:transposase